MATAAMTPVAAISSGSTVVGDRPGARSRKARLGWVAPALAPSAGNEKPIAGAARELTAFWASAHDRGAIGRAEVARHHLRQGIERGGEQRPASAAGSTTSAPGRRMTTAPRKPATHGYPARGADPFLQHPGPDSATMKSGGRVEQRETASARGMAAIAR